MKIWIDSYRCVGHAACCEEAPDLLGWDDAANQAVASVEEVPSGQEARARAAAKACPERAVMVSE